MTTASDTRTGQPLTPDELTARVAAALAEHATYGLAVIAGRTAANLDLYDDTSDLDQDTCTCGAPATYGCTYTGDLRHLCPACHTNTCHDPACR